MVYLFILAWILSPPVLIILCAVKSRENSKLKYFIDKLYRCKRISGYEFSNLLVNEPEKMSDTNRQEGSPSAAVFADGHEYSRVHSTKYAANTFPGGNGSDMPTVSETYTADTAVQKSIPERKPLNNIGAYAYQTHAAPAVTAAEKYVSESSGSTVHGKKDTVCSDKKQAAAMSVLMMIGIIFVILAGLVFSTAVWTTLGSIGRTLTVAGVSAMFFGISAFTGKKLELDRTSFAFYTLGAFFSAITLITAGFFGIMGTYFSVTGNGCFLLYALSLLMICLISAKGHSIFDRPAAAYIAAFSGAFSAVLILVHIAPEYEIFALLLAVFTAALDIFAYVIDIQISGKWKKPVQTAAAVLNIAALLSGISASFGNSSVFYAVSAVFVLRSAAAAVMGFGDRRVYNTRIAAVSSLASGALFSLLALIKISDSIEIFALSSAVFGLAFSFAMFTFDIKIPENWNSPIKATAFILNTVGVISSFYALADNSGEWNGICFAAAGVYIVSSLAAGILAVKGYPAYTGKVSAFAAMFIGSAFSIMLISELSKSSEINSLCMTILLLVLINTVYTLSFRLPDSWKTAADVLSAIIGIISVFNALLALIGNFMNRDAVCLIISLLYIIQCAVITAAAHMGHSEYSKKRWAVISQLVGTVFSVITLYEYAADHNVFMILFTVFAAVYLNFAHTFRFNRPERWVRPLKIISMIYGTFGIFFLVAEMFDTSVWTYHIYVSAAVYIAYSISAAAMAFMGHGEYSERRWAVISYLTVIGLSAMIIYETAASEELFILSLSVFAVLFSVYRYLAFLKIPEKWVKVTKITDILFNAAAAFTALLFVYERSGSWDIYCFAAAAVYIIYTSVRGVCGKNSIFKAAECIISSFTAYELYCIMCGSGFAVPEFLLVCMLFAIAVIHHFVKPLRTLFSDIFLSAGLAVSAALCALTFCLSGYNICGTLGFILFGAAMLIKAAETDKKRAAVFKAILPLPVSGIVYSFVHFVTNISDLSAVNGIVLALTAAAVFIEKRNNIIFYSFAFTASLFIFAGTASKIAAVLIILLAASIMLTVLFCRCGNNIPSLLTMAVSAATVYRLAETASLYADFNVFLLFAAVFAGISLAASRIFYSKKLLDREGGRLCLDTCCLEILLALPLIRSEDEKVIAFAALTILSAFAADLIRKEHSDDANRISLTAAAGLFAAALIFRPFLIVSDILVSRKITLGIICAFGYVFSKIWKKYPKLAENLSSAVYSISFICLITDALSHQNLFNTLIVLGVSALILLYSFISKKKRWFAVSSVSLTGLTVYTFRGFFAMIEWWVYLLIVGLILIAVSAANEYFVRKGREFKEKAGRFFEDWKW